MFPVPLDQSTGKKLGPAPHEQLQAACQCLKSLAGSIKQLSMGVGAVAGIPAKCSVAVPYADFLNRLCKNQDPNRAPSQIQYKTHTHHVQS
jgi:hypothetical protein